MENCVSSPDGRSGGKNAMAGDAPLTAGSEIALTSEEMSALRAKAAKADEHWDTLLRTTADFDNFKKRAARERQDALRFATEGMLEKLIPVIDNFEMALLAAQQGQNANSDSLRTGVNMIYQQLKSVLSDAGLTEILAQGQVFDPNVHEAVSQEETTDLPEGHVIKQLRKGYRLRDRLLRPATVVVAKAPAQS